MPKVVCVCGCRVNKKDVHVCTECKLSLCGKHIYFKVDGNNASITKYSPLLCEKCFINRYGVNR